MNAAKRLHKLSIKRKENKQNEEGSAAAAAAAAAADAADADDNNFLGIILNAAEEGAAAVEDSDVWPYDVRHD